MRLLVHSFAALAVAALASFPAAAQAYKPPRTPDGKPDLQGMWTNSSITTLERFNWYLPLVLTSEQAARLEQQRARENAAADSRTNPNEGAPAGGGSICCYNNFFFDHGQQVGVVKGQPRSSWIVDPSNGRLPFSEVGRKRIAAILAKRSDDGPEGMNPADRCLVGSRGSGGPPMLNNLYNNTYQIVQTPTHVMIDVEMMHDARIIRIGENHRPEPLKQWLGDSVGRWEDDTLVVVTRNWHRWHGDYEPVYLSETATITERFTRTAADEIAYEFLVDDPGFYSQPWKGEMVFTPSSGPVYEYACHEANYALLHILTGARMAETRR